MGLVKAVVPAGAEVGRCISADERQRRFWRRLFGWRGHPAARRLYHRKLFQAACELRLQDSLSRSVSPPFAARGVARSARRGQKRRVTGTFAFPPFTDETEHADAGQWSAPCKGHKRLRTNGFNLVAGSSRGITTTAWKAMHRWSSLRRAFLQPYEDHAKLVENELQRRRRREHLALPHQGGTRSVPCLSSPSRGNPSTGHVGHYARDAGAATRCSPGPCSIGDTGSESPRERSNVITLGTGNHDSLVRNFETEMDDGGNANLNTSPRLILRFLPQCGPRVGATPFLFDTHLLLGPERYGQRGHWLARSRLRTMLVRIQRDNYRLRRRLEEDRDPSCRQSVLLPHRPDGDGAGAAGAGGHGPGNVLVEPTANIGRGSADGWTYPYCKTGAQTTRSSETDVRAGAHKDPSSTTDVGEKFSRKVNTTEEGTLPLAGCQEGVPEGHDDCPHFTPSLVSSIAPVISLAPEVATAIEACVKLQFLPPGLLFRLACHLSSSIGQLSLQLSGSSPVASLKVPSSNTCQSASAVDSALGIRTAVRPPGRSGGTDDGYDEVCTVARDAGTWPLTRGHALLLTARAWVELQQLLGWLNTAARAAVYTPAKAAPGNGDAEEGESCKSEAAEATGEQRSIWRTFEQCYRALAFQPVWRSKPCCVLPDSGELEASTAAYWFQVRYECLSTYTKLLQLLDQWPPAHYGSRHVPTRLESATRGSSSLLSKHARDAETDKGGSALTSDGASSWCTALGCEPEETPVVPPLKWAHTLIEFMAVSMGLIPERKARLTRRSISDGNTGASGCGDCSGPLGTPGKEVKWGNLKSPVGNVLRGMAVTTHDLPDREQMGSQLGLKELTQFLNSIQTLKLVLGDQNSGHADTVKDAEDAQVLAGCVHARLRRSLKRILDCGGQETVQPAAHTCPNPENVEVKRRQLLDALVALAIDEAQTLCGQRRNARDRPAQTGYATARFPSRQPTDTSQGVDVSISQTSGLQSDLRAAGDVRAEQLDCFDVALSEIVSRLAVKAKMPRGLLAKCVRRELCRRGKRVKVQDELSNVC
ncbi:hypothetical protein CSUI_006292 [Cystoisospora suis]|uniref:Uncharacterized protein n=1 Tax=Cystoisospora suis TaxID=483139 RepID=A0A2C6KUZ5_9APIC|nr:hypothetical protein CSUI_006292 [Cystoisospora suis]